MTSEGTNHDACQGIVDMLSELLDGGLGGAELAAVTLHLETCADCARFAAELAATVEALHRLRPAVLSRGSRTPAATPWRSTAPPSQGRSSSSSS
jgi:anti-sigma factor RsiW